MSDVWWSYPQACNYLLAHYPCEDLMDASGLLFRKVEDGTLPTRYKDHSTGKYIDIRPDEWRRNEENYILEWEGSELTHRGVEYQAAAVQSLRATTPGPVARGGRPPNPGWAKFYIEATRYIHENGLPATQAELERYLLEWSENNLKNPPGESSIRTHVRGLFEALRRE